MSSLRFCKLNEDDDENDNYNDKYDLSCARWSKSSGVNGLLYSSGLFREWKVIENESNIYDVRVFILIFFC